MEGAARPHRSASTGFATCSVSSTRRSTTSQTIPRIGGGNVPAIATSAMPNAQNSAPGRNPCGSAAATNASTASGSMGSAPFERDAHRREVEAAHPLQRTRREHPREVRAGGRRAAVGRDPLHPRARMREEVLRRREREARAGRHRRRQAADEAHVVVQRQPRHEHVLVDVERGRLARSRRGSSTALAAAASRPSARWSSRS